MNIAPHAAAIVADNHHRVPCCLSRINGVAQRRLAEGRIGLVEKGMCAYCHFVAVHQTLYPLSCDGFNRLGHWQPRAQMLSFSLPYHSQGQRVF